MNTGQAKQTIIFAVFVSALLASVKPVQKGQAPDIRIALGAAMLAVMLLGLAEFQPQLAGAFGLLVLISSMFAVGPDVYDTLTVATGHQPEKRK